MLLVRDTGARVTRYPWGAWFRAHTKLAAGNTGNAGKSDLCWHCLLLEAPSGGRRGVARNAGNAEIRSYRSSADQSAAFWSRKVSVPSLRSPLR